MLEREWVSIRDPGDPHRRYTFDISFLLSGYACIYGRGCQGVGADGPDDTVGCCIHGAYYVDDDDRTAVEQLVHDALDETSMERYALAAAEGVTAIDDEGEAHTKLVDGACIFLNSRDFVGGTGCALHLLAGRRSEHPMTYKPVVCWQLPLHRTISEEVGNDGETFETHTIAPFERGTWGEGGADFHWWCTEDPAAYSTRTPVFRSMEHELRAMVGDEVYDELSSYLRRRARSRSLVRYLPLA